MTIQEKWKTQYGLYKCPYCSKDFKKAGIGGHIWRVHGAGKKHTTFKGKIPWNAGLTKENSQILREKSERLKARYKNGDFIGSFKGKRHSPETIAKMKANPNQGGPGRGGGRGKQGRYKGYWCDSSWELAYIIYCLDHDIKIVRNTKKFEYIFEEQQYNYVPDFIQNGVYIEIKGYVTPQWRAKLEGFSEPLVVLYAQDMAPYLRYVIDKYGKEFINLYE